MKGMEVVNRLSFIWSSSSFSVFPLIRQNAVEVPVLEICKAGGISPGTRRTRPMSIVNFQIFKSGKSKTYTVNFFLKHAFYGFNSYSSH